MADLDDTNGGGEDDEPSAPFWMATFSDMATLLLTFFVMIVAMSEVEVKKFKAALSYFQGNTGFLENVAVVPPTVDPTILRRPQQESMMRAQKMEEIEEVIQRLDLQDKVEVTLTERGVHVVLTDSIMFRSGQADLLPTSRELLGEVANKLEGEVHSVMVEGHTDNQPIRSIRFPSNWELSTARAASVVRYLLTLESALPGERYMPVGYGEFRPKESNDTGDGRNRNRRVEILFSWEEWQTKTEQ